MRPQFRMAYKKMIYPRAWLPFHTLAPIVIRIITSKHWRSHLNLMHLVTTSREALVAHTQDNAYAILHLCRPPCLRNNHSYAHYATLSQYIRLYCAYRNFDVRSAHFTSLGPCNSVMAQPPPPAPVSLQARDTLADASKTLSKAGWPTPKEHNKAWLMQNNLLYNCITDFLTNISTPQPIRTFLQQPSSYCLHFQHQRHYDHITAINER